MNEFVLKMINLLFFLLILLIQFNCNSFIFEFIEYLQLFVVIQIYFSYQIEVCHALSKKKIEDKRIYLM